MRINKGKLEYHSQLQFDNVLNKAWLTSVSVNDIEGNWNTAPFVYFLLLTF